MQHTKFISKPPFSVSTCVFDKASSIRLALFDVDGVMTDGTLYFDQHGEALKAFNVLDGQGLKLLQKSGIEVGVISARKSPALQQRIDNLGIQHAFTGVDDKLATFEKLHTSLNILPEHCCFTGMTLLTLKSCAPAAFPSVLTTPITQLKTPLTGLLPNKVAMAPFEQFAISSSLHKTHNSS